METMVERVAEAMWKRQVLLGDPEEFMDLARAAIEAMREPTEEMMRAGSNAPIRDWSTTAETFADDPSPIYSAMIDEALTATKTEQPPA